MQNWNSKFKNFNTFYFLLVLLTFAFLLLTSFAQVKAQVSLQLLVAPARQELTLDPGEKTAVNVRFYNRGDSPISGILRVADFIVDNSQGVPRILEDPQQVSPKFSASTWITLPYDRITIAANDKVSIQASITLPSDARPGGRYTAIFFEPAGVVPQAVGSPKEAALGVASRIASLLYIRVSGEARETALISNFFSQSFWEYGPIEVETSILNRGDYHIRPRGLISLTNFLGGLVAQEKLKEQNIFPDMASSYKNTIGKKWMFGKYRLAINASYGEKGQALTRSLEVWVFPWRVALIIVLSLIILALLIRSLITRFKTQEVTLEHELKEEKDEIEKLKEQLKKRQE